MDVKSDYIIALRELSSVMRDWDRHLGLSIDAHSYLVTYAAALDIIVDNIEGREIPNAD